MTPDPKPYQNTGIDFLASSAGAMLGDDAGLGKSLQLIRAFERAGFTRGLIACPAIGRVSWADQLGTWQTRQLPFYFYPDQTGGLVPANDHWLIVTLEWLSRRQQALKMISALRHATPMDALIVDEAHYLKTPTAWRTRAVYGPRLNFHNSIGEATRARWIASATFTPNHAGELYPHLMAVLPYVLRSLFNGKLPTQAEFERRYCYVQNTPYGPKITGNRRDMIPELRDALKPHLLARRKEDVLADLDPIHPVLLPLEADISPDPVDDLLDLALGKDDFDLARLTTSKDAIASRRRELGEAKVKPAIEWIENFLLSSGRKLVVFAHHRTVIDQLTNAPRLAQFAPVAVHGGTMPAVKALNVSTFQNESCCRLFIGQTIAAGTSITLTAAQDVLLLEPDWTPDNNYQAISRCHRIGQVGSVTAYFASAAGTVDDRIARALRRKAEDIVQLFGGTVRGVA